MNADTRTPETATETPEGTGGHDDTLRASERRHGRDNARDKTATVKPLLLSAPDAAAALGIGQSLLWDLHARAMIPEPVRLGARTLWRREELESWTEAGCPSREKWQEIKKKG